jgi:hypothetical protein
MQYVHLARNGNKRYNILTLLVITDIIKTKERKGVLNAKEFGLPTVFKMVKRKR